MASLKIGDIEIDGSRVSIDGRPMTGGEPSPGGQLVRREPEPLVAAARAPIGDSLAPLGELPFRPRTWITAGVAVAACGVLALVLHGSLDVVTYVFGGGLLVSIGGALAGLGVLKRLAKRRAKERRIREEDAVVAPVVERLRALLREANAEQSVAWIARQTALAEPIVVRALARLRESGELREELNEQTGDWYYVHVPGEPPPPRARDLDSRLDEIQRSER